MTKHTPEDLMNLLRYVDVNGLTDSEANAIAGVDIDKDDQLEVLMRTWLRPQVAEFGDCHFAEMLQLLGEADSWGSEDIARVFAKIRLPSGQPVTDPVRFVRAMKAGLLGETL